MKLAWKAAALLTGALICGLSSARAQGTSTLFFDNFNSYAPGSSLAGQGGWYQDPTYTAPLILSTTTPLGTVAIDGTIRTGTGQYNASSYGVVRHALPPLNPNAVTVVSANAYAYSAYMSHDAGIWIGNANFSVVLQAQASWYPSHSPTWLFSSDLFSGAFDQPVLLQIIIDGGAGQYYFRFTYSGGTYETPHHSITAAQIAQLTSVMVQEDYRDVYLGIAIDNVRVTTNSCPTSTCILTPTDGASPSSQFAAISGTGTPGDTLNVLVGGLSVGQVQVDSEGNWEALPYVSLYGSSVTIQVQDQTSSNLSNTITVHPSLASFLPGPSSPPNSLTALLPLRKADIFVTASPTSLQYSLYGPQYTHTALYLGGDSNGTPLIAEAIKADEAGSPLGTNTGQVAQKALDKSFVWTQSTSVSALRWTTGSGLPGATRSAIVAWAQNIANQGLPYWSNADLLLPSGAYLLYNAFGGVLSGGVLTRFNLFLNELNDLKYSTSTFICSTLVWRAYYEGTSHGVDLSNPNLMLPSYGSMAGFAPAFVIVDLRPVLVLPQTIAVSPQLSPIF